MPIQSGTHLGPYEILSAIGAGRMGEVYKRNRPSRDLNKGDNSYECADNQLHRVRVHFWWSIAGHAHSSSLARRPAEGRFQGCSEALYGTRGYNGGLGARIVSGFR